MATVSVIVPAYKTSQYITNCLDSIVSQTLKDIEIICIDDGSVDSTPFILDEYSKRDSRIKVLHVPNGGVSKARNIGLDLAKDKYISFVDSDDVISPDMLEKMVEVCKGSRRLEEYYGYLNTKETITFLTRFIGHKDVKAETIDKLKSRVRKCSKGYFHNPLLTNKEIIQVFVASKVPNLYINTVLTLKRIRGVLCE